MDASRFLHAPGMEGVAPHDPPQAVQNANQETVQAEGADRVFRAARIETATVAEVRGYQTLVASQEADR
jgi:hypothetical protein